MIGNLPYPDLTTCGKGAEQNHVRKAVRAQQWADGIPSFGLSGWKTRTLKELFRVKRLADNWDGEGSPQPATIALDAASELLVSLPFEDLSDAFVSPTSVGGVQLEWTQHGRELEIEILPDGSMEFLIVVDGDPRNEGLIAKDQVPSLVQWLREPDQTPTGGILLGRINRNRT